MRIIKFRGKASNGEWVYGSLIQGEAHNKKGESFMVSYIAPSIPVASEDGFELLKMDRVYPETVGQFTGLYDKDHNEIYEGDILSAQGIDEKLEVRFVRGVFAFLWNGDLDDEFPTGSPTHEWAGVVGNIHDNKDLLKKGGEE